MSAINGHGEWNPNSSIVDGITNDQARATTLRLVARQPG
jgi:hypothetical protein